MASLGLGCSSSDPMAAAATATTVVDDDVKEGGGSSCSSLLLLAGSSIMGWMQVTSETLVILGSRGSDCRSATLKRPQGMWDSRKKRRF